MKHLILNAAVIGSLLLVGCTGQPNDKPSTSTPPVVTPPVVTPPVVTPPVVNPPVVTPPVTDNRVKIRSINFKDLAVARYMEVVTAGKPDMYADEVKSLLVEEASELSWLQHFSQLKTLIVTREVNNIVDLSGNPLLETLDIKADSLLLGKNNRLTHLTAKVNHLEFPSASQLIQLNLTHSPVIAPSSKTLYAAGKNPSLGKYLKLDLSSQSQLKKLLLTGQFEEILLPSSSTLEEFNLSGSATATLTGLAGQTALKSLHVVVDKNTQALNLSALSQLQYLNLTADGLHSFDLTGLPKLQTLILKGANISQFKSDGIQDVLDSFSLNAPKLSSFDLTPYKNLQNFQFGNGVLSSLTIANPTLTGIEIGNTQLKNLNLNNCAALRGVVIGYNLFERLDLSKCQKLADVRNYPSTVDSTRDVLETNMVLPSGSERYTPWYANKSISLLNHFDVPDERLLSCIRAAAAAEKAIYTYQLKNLICRGQNGPSYAQAFVSRQEGRTDIHTKSYVFDITGLELFNNLETIDLSVNWIAQLGNFGMPLLKTLILDGNIIQDLNLGGLGSLTQLSLSSNPLHRLTLLDQVAQFTAIGGSSVNSYVSDILGKYNLDILRDYDGAWLSLANFSQPYSLHIDRAYSLIDVQSDRVTWPAVTLPGEARLRVVDLAFEDPRLFECITRMHTFVDEVKTLTCSNAGRVPSQSIRSLKGLNQLTNLRQLELYGHDLGAADFSELKNLKKLIIGQSLLTQLDVSKNPGLEVVAFANPDQKNPNLELDFSRNINLRNIDVSGVRQVKLPESASLEKLSLRFVTDVISTDNAAPILDLSRYTGLYSVHVERRLSSLILPQTSVLETLRCFRCRLQTLINLEKQQHLVNLSLGLPAQLSQLDLSIFPHLQDATITAQMLHTLSAQNNARLKTLVLAAPELTTFNAARLTALDRLNLNTPKLSSLEAVQMPMLTELLLSEHGLKQLDVSGLSQLKKLSLGDGALQELTLGNNYYLETLSIGNGQLKTLDFSGLTGLTALHIGRNPLTTLDLQANVILQTLTYTEPAPADIRPHIGGQLTVNVVPATKIAQLTPADMPDPVLRKCVATAASEQGAIYTDELKYLSCRGLDSKTRAVALSGYINGESLVNDTCCIFSLKGLALFTNLSSVDLTGNWISEIFPEDITLSKLTTLILDHNVIQNLTLPDEVILGEQTIASQLHTLSLNANPLGYLDLPSTLRYLSAAAGDSWVYTEIALNRQYNKSPMLDWLTGAPISLADYSRPFSVRYLGDDLQVNSTKFVR